MATRLPPPYVEGTLPAFYAKDGTAILAVPFALGRTTSKTAIKQYVMKIKTLNSSYYLLAGENNTQEVRSTEIENNVVYFRFNSDILNVGMFYKIQLAFEDLDGTIGFYSSVSLAKFTTKPTVKIEGLSSGQNLHYYNYVGRYIQEDKTERVLNYQFNLYDDKDELVATSGELLHNSNDDISFGESIDQFEYPQDLEEDRVYTIQYTVRTMNNLIASSERYKLVQKDTITSNLDGAVLTAIPNDDGGYNEIYFSTPVLGANDSKTYKKLTGFYALSRSSEDNNYRNWEIIYRFVLKNDAYKTPQLIFKDCFIEQGKKYAYSLQQYNIHGIYSNRLIANLKGKEFNPVVSDYEDMYLYDGKRQLRIRFNPRVSSFKSTVTDVKIDTLGNKYPYFLRNGKADYKEFPISGLISYQMDEAKMFYDNGDFNFTTNLTSENIYNERQFKLEVLEWLNNGEPKLFKSPAEGNYIVRLMNVSLQPNDTLGRMIHTFNCQAYECMEYTFKNLIDSNIMVEYAAVTSPVQKYQISTYYIKDLLQNPVVLPKKINSIKITEATPGSKCRINGVEVMIGATGEYNLNEEITSFEWIDGDLKFNPSIVCSYFIDSYDLFDQIVSTEIIEVPCRQFIGECDIIDQLTNFTYVNQLTKEEERLHNYKFELNTIYKIKFEVRPKASKYWIKEESSEKATEAGYNIIPECFYDDISGKENTEIYNSISSIHIVWNNGKEQTLTINHQGVLELPFDQIPKKIETSSSVIAYVTYSARNKNYIYEQNELSEERKKYDNATSEAEQAELLYQLGQLIERDNGIK